VQVIGILEKNKYIMRIKYQLEWAFMAGCNLLVSLEDSQDRTCISKMFEQIDKISQQQLMRTNSP
jgi:hypothetical protein